MTTIAVWLDSQPDDPSDYEFKGRLRKRPRLAEVSGNSMSEPRRSRRRSPRKDRIAPTTPPRSSPGPEAGGTRDGDAETPRPAPSMAAIPALYPSSSAPPAAAASGPATARSPSPSRSSTTSWASGTSSRRLRSPVRRLGDLQLSSVHVRAVTLEKPGQAPADVRELCRDIRRVGRGIGLLPSAVKGRAAALLDDDLLDDLNFGDSDGSEQQRAEHEGFWAAANSLMEAANECEEEDLCEADWNNEVHSRALRLALERGRSERAVWYRNVTTAQIKDQSLLPGSAAGLATQSKMVDFAVVLDARSDERLANLVRAKLRHDGLSAINHTTAEHVRFSPIAVSIETKRAAIEEDVANAQLAVWVSAHFRWLQRLSNGGSALPTLPLVIVQGHEWKLMLAELEDGSEMRIFRHLSLGTTRSVLGIYQLAASLRRLAEWANDTYRPWLERALLT
ncbi:hypothetical protein MPH_13323 [Macrophomina phaseolina MS6]|uniref:PD-(D/E)XK nuclease-like domain-containing protein n=1 Tax=Macrophomina phaseolina (strain MS6) TaxID=1126212 RepID=K2RYX1_MACPH|nr:hypothetical protein MPH_13323 [Macrophomina phaseolina MS6]